MRISKSPSVQSELKLQQDDKDDEGDAGIFV